MKTSDETTLAPNLALRKQIVGQDLPSDLLAILLAADLSPAISSFVVDPGYTSDNNQCISGVANGPPPLLRAAFPFDAPLDAVP